MKSLTGGLRPYLLLSLLCLLLYLPGQAALPPMDRDESRFIQATRQMLESGDFVRIQFQDEMRAKKPAGVYWLQAMAVKALSHPASAQVWPYRLPSLLAAWAAVLMTFGFGRALVGERPALLAGVLLGTALMLASEAHQAKTDAILLACTVAAQVLLARFYVAGRAKEMTGGGSGGGSSCSSGGCGSQSSSASGCSSTSSGSSGRGDAANVSGCSATSAGSGGYRDAAKASGCGTTSAGSGGYRETAPNFGAGAAAAKSLIAGPGVAEALAFWLIQGAAILVKGPVVPVISLLTIITLGIADRNLRWFNSLKPLWGSMVAAAMALPWFLAISHATGGAFVGTAVKQDLLPKLLGAQESHGGFPGLYLLLAAALFWPGSLLLGPAVAKLWAQRQRLVYRFLLAWALPTWLMFELIPTKLPHYVLPAFPALALMGAALAVEGAEIFRARAAKIWFGFWTLIGLTLAAAVVVLPFKLGNGVSPASVAAALGIALATLLPAWLALRGQIVQAGMALALTAIATYPAVFQAVLPSLDRIFLSRGIAAIVQSVGSDGPVAAAGYGEPSLVFLLGTKTRLTDGHGAAEHLKSQPGALAVVADRERVFFLEQARALGMTPEDFGSVSGINYSRGKPATLTVYGVTAP